VNYPELTRGWFAQLVPAELANGVLRVQAANPAQARYLQEHCSRPFAEAAQAALGRFVTFQFEASPDDGRNRDDGPSPFGHEEVATALNQDYTFDNFITGPANRLAHAAAVAVAERPGKAYNPLFIHGSVGLGKTHLMQAVCHAVRDRSAPNEVLYLTCEDFTNHFLDAVERGLLNRFRYRYRHVSVLVIDDIQFLAQRERSQEEFFHTFNTLQQSQRQIVLSADCSPSEIPSLQARLTSRFNSGLVAPVDPPCLETRIAILRTKAKLRCIEVPEDVLQIIAAHVDSNIRELEGALIRLDAISHTRDGRIDAPLAREALGFSGPARPVTIPLIIDAVTLHFSVKPAELMGKKRSRSIAFPRQVCMSLARELTGHSLEEIGGYFGGRDHSTVLHACRVVREQAEIEAELRETLDYLRKRLKEQARTIAPRAAAG